MSVTDVTPPWLTEALVASGALDECDPITSICSSPIGVGVGLMSELHRATYRSAGGSQGSVVVKLSVDNELRATVDALGLYRRELDFYRDLAGTVPVRTPRLHLALEAEGSTDFVLVLEDFGALTAGDQLVGLQPHRVEAAVDAVALLHAWAWEDPDRLGARCGRFPQISNETTRATYPTYFAAGWASYLTHANQEPGAALIAAAAGWATGLPALLEVLATPATFCHGDFRADNLFFDADGTVAVIDFQLAHTGCGISDVAYLVSQSVHGASRDDHERLVRRYCGALEAAGVTYAEEEAWRQYRAAVLFHLVEAVVATLSWPSLGERGRQLVLRLVERAERAIGVTDAVALLRT